MALKFVFSGTFIAPVFRTTIRSASYEAFSPSKVPKFTGEPVDIRNIFALGWASTRLARSSKTDISYLRDTEELPKRCMKDSYSEALLPLATDEAYRARMTNIHGGLRIGRVLEAIDMVGGWISIEHCLDDVIWIDRSQLPMFFATVLVDHAILHESSVKADRDVKIRGNVIHTGKTSLQIRMEAVQDWGEEGWRTFLEARHMYVARNWETLGPVKVNQLEARDEKERKLLKKVQNESLRHRTAVAQSQNKVVPSADILEQIHGIVLQHRSHLFPTTDKVTPSQTQLSTILFCHPQIASLNKFVFGGFLIRVAYELAWANAYNFCHKPPTFFRMDDVIFHKPIEVGYVVQFLSNVVYTSSENKSFFVIHVSAEILNAEEGKRETATTVYFTFKSDDPVGDVIPKTYQEVLMYFGGKEIYKKTIAVQENI